ncbi:MAG TPA: ribosomal L7Ae/L30e/S12e/Gadd45 family protein [Candidatus Limnocylindria bacterium]|nr:ribosomal L7Ae/L30e/S12e/Gadd45 family protein [Candidatus Limnocylindria bacterium]
MRDKLRNPHGRTVGFRQTLKALQAGRVQALFLAGDAPEEMRDEALREAAEAGVPVEGVPTMRELGRLCAIQVPAALAAVLKGP